MRCRSVFAPLRVAVATPLSAAAASGRSGLSEVETDPSRSILSTLKVLCAILPSDVLNEGCVLAVSRKQ